MVSVEDLDDSIPMDCIGSALSALSQEFIEEHRSTARRGAEVDLVSDTWNGGNLK
jgi:hypothetical protein